MPQDLRHEDLKLKQGDIQAKAGHKLTFKIYDLFIHWGIFAQSQDCEPSQRRPLIENGSVDTSIARQRLCKHTIIPEQLLGDTHATIEELLGVVFSMRPIPRLYNGDQLQLLGSWSAYCMLKKKNQKYPNIDAHGFIRVYLFK
jgi:hypothetical protein